MQIEILTSASMLEEQLKLIEKVGREAYQSAKEGITLDSARKFIKARMKQGHMSLLEHGTLSVLITDASRAMGDELRTHRPGCSFVMMSTRFVNCAEAEVVLPPAMRDDAQAQEMAYTAFLDYQKLLAKGYKKEDCRQFLPLGMTNRLACTANFKAWHYIAGLRGAKPAHWEVRSVITTLVAMMKEKLSPIFDEFEVVGQCRSGVDYFASRKHD